MNIGNQGRTAVRIAASLAAAAASGCANVYHSRDMMSAASDSQGIVYALPTTWLEISATAVDREVAKGGPYQRIAVVEKVLPDASHVYSLDHATSAFSTDEITIEVGADQLLDKVNTKTEDVTDQIIVALAKTVASVASFSVPKSAPGVGMSQTCAAPPAGAWTYTIDPYDDTTWPTDWLRPGCIKLTPIGSTAANFSQTKGSEDCAKGICHRAPVPTRVQFDFGGSGRYEVIVGLLNKAPILSIDIDRTMFVEKKMNLTFDKGVISKMEITRPSPALAAVSLPLDVVKALLTAPAEIFKLKIDYSKAAASDASEQKAMLVAQEAFEKYLAELRAKDAAAN